MTKLLGISGSLRKNSFNTVLLNAAVKSFDPSDYTQADLNLPLYSQDIEDAGFPDAVQTLHDQMQAADAIIIATPEYNGNIPGVLKNALDWVSRIKPMPMTDKPLAIMSATAGRAGGVLALSSLRQSLPAFQPKLLQGPLVAVAGAFNAFDENGDLKEESYQKAVDGLMEKLKSSI